MSDFVQIRQLYINDIVTIVEAFNAIGWDKPRAIFEQYLMEQQAGERLVWLAFVQEHISGYITLKWQSLYKPFNDCNIPEIMDLNVLPQFRKIGIASHLLQVAEQEACTRSDVVGIGVGLYAGQDGGYGAAQRLYVKSGYIPNGRGVTYNYQPTIPGNSYQLDDDLILWLTKKLC
jgi:GNAT superfamily N-acetyltransferase